ncbi:protein NO VEIN domain-containing protein [Streptomyces sp. NPDC006527]|uniref:protein NO VEIN domain-containing protein n=1 Tax=Streptomyces sp. NPDC006527 TaxID=3364749 RepID=UPI00369329C2
MPPEPVLRAAVRWLDRLPASGVARVRALFTTHSDFSDITPTQYDAAYGWIREVGLLDQANSDVPVERRVFEAAMTRSEVPWFRDADLLIRSPDELPEDAMRAAETLGLTPEAAYAQVSTAWGKVDTEERSRIGSAGELALLELLSASADGRVEHVAAWSDGYGYDIFVDAHQHSAHLEVKTTVRVGRLTVYISRNEYETMLRDPAWELVTVRLTPDLKLRAVAVVPRTWIAGQVPADRSAQGRWESCRLDIPPDIPVPGIPSIAPILAPTAPEVLRARPGRVDGTCTPGFPAA